MGSSSWRNRICGSAFLDEMAVLRRSIPDGGRCHLVEDKEEAVGTASTASEDEGAVEVCHILQNKEAGVIRPLDRTWCLEDPCCIVLDQAIRILDLKQ